jgi:hypothetical protein
MLSPFAFFFAYQFAFLRHISFAVRSSVMTSILLSVQKVFACIFANFSFRVPNDTSIATKRIDFSVLVSLGVPHYFCSMFIAFLSWEVLKTFWRPVMFSFPWQCLSLSMPAATAYRANKNCFISLDIEICTCFLLIQFIRNSFIRPGS